jgi:hypothetical protein
MSFRPHFKRLLARAAEAALDCDKPPLYIGNRRQPPRSDKSLDRLPRVQQPHGRRARFGGGDDVLERRPLGAAALIEGDRLEGAVRANEGRERRVTAVADQSARQVEV